jgi:hypothetical protein
MREALLSGEGLRVERTLRRDYPQPVQTLQSLIQKNFGIQKNDEKE